MMCCGYNSSWCRRCLEEGDITGRSLLGLCGQVTPGVSQDRDPGESGAGGGLIENLMFLLRLSEINIQRAESRDNPLIKPDWAQRGDRGRFSFYTKHKTINTKKSHQYLGKTNTRLIICLPTFIFKVVETSSLTTNLPACLPKYLLELELKEIQG